MRSSSNRLTVHDIGASPQSSMLEAKPVCNLRRVYPESSLKVAPIPLCFPIGKRIFDLVVSLALLLLTFPVMMVTALAIKFTSIGPVILRQRRLTAGGREFVLLKFRSMRQDAETVSGPVFAGSNDLRVTPVGRFIRKTRLDELPQLINVIRGDMSLIGPRPERPEVAEKLRRSVPHFDKRLGTKAGLTGLAQVVQGYADDESSYKEKVAWDVLYIRKRSMKLDLWITFRTIKVIMTGTGAR